MQGELLLLLAVDLLLTALPGVAAALLLAGRGERRTPVLLAVLLAVSAGVALLGFWAYWSSHAVGQTWSWLVLLGSLLVIGWQLLERRVPRAVLRDLAIPLGLWALGSGFLVFLGFMHGGTDQAIVTSSTRFTASMPTDNLMPLYWADWFYGHSHHGRPPEFPGGWLSSDRPPLQMGYVLTQRPFHLFGSELDYQVLGVCLQQLWIVGLWALLGAFGVGRVTKAATTATLLVSDLTVVNGFYVWPKLLPAALLLAAAALLLTPLWDELRGSLWGGMLVAALLGLAMMGHGASVYGIVALLAVAAFRGLPDPRWIGVAVLTLVIVMAPWSAYGKWFDPPGDRLTKWYLAGDVGPDEKSVGEAIREAYGEAKLTTLLHARGQNFAAIFGGGPMATNLREAREGIERTDGKAVEETLRPLRLIAFFDLVPSLGLLLLGPVAMAIAWARRRRRPPADAGVDWRTARMLLGTFALGAVAWALIQWGGSVAQTVIHQGSYLIPALGLAGCTVALRAVWPRFALAWLALNAVVMLALYVPDTSPVEGTRFAPASAAIAAVLLLGFLALAFVPGRPDRDPDRRGAAASA